MGVGTRPSPRGGASKARTPFLEDRRTYKDKELGAVMGVGVVQQELKLGRHERSLQGQGLPGCLGR